MKQCNVAIIGGGVIGCAIARELSRYQLSICVIEKEEDVCCGTSKANSAIAHAGYDAKTGSMKAKLNVEGNQRMEALAKELEFEFKRNGSLVLALEDGAENALQILYQRGIANGVKDLKLLSPQEVSKMEPNVSEAVKGALYAPTGGIVCPFGLTIALAENAHENGVTFLFHANVEKITKQEVEHRVTKSNKKYTYELSTSKGTIYADSVINAAGVYADELHNMVSEHKLEITARKGEYCLFDKQAGSFVTHTIFQLPTVYGKGVLVTPTVHGNLLVGPTSVKEPMKESTATSALGLDTVLKKAEFGVRNLPTRQIITSFAGLRAHEAGDDFVIKEVEDSAGFFDVAGIESPGLSCAPAIGVHVAKMVADFFRAGEKTEFVSKRKGILRMNELSVKERADFIKKNPLYGQIVCRCEMVSEGEIVDAIKRPLGATSVDGIKRRTRTGMGRCQAGFCTPRTLEILARELQVPMEQLCKSKEGSYLLTRKNR